MIKLYTLFFTVIITSSCLRNKTELVNKQEFSYEINKIQVLNFGTFHMGYTNDKSTTEFDEHNIENQKKIHQIAKQLSKFKPTVILVETVPEYDQKLQTSYKNYLKDSNIFFKHPNEIQLLAFEVGRLSGVEKIYGIDHKMSYNYNIGNEMKNSLDSSWYKVYRKNPISFFPEVNINEDSLNLLNKLKLSNHDRYLDFLIAVNADNLTHIGSAKGFEGADEASLLYQRNLRMYSNINRINLEKGDRVFILMGATHTAFFRDFMSRSHKYEMVNTFEYLK